ncbi:MAG: RDD family protein, partial [Verrucomicrobia bacterium]|nr:RDD family protein [Verrucomicrobiota bacterium]
MTRTLVLGLLLWSGLACFAGTPVLPGNDDPIPSITDLWIDHAEKAFEFEIAHDSGHTKSSHVISGDQVISGQTYVLPKGESVSGDLVVIRSHADIQGTINGDLVLLFSDATINGIVNGDVVTIGSKMDYGAGSLVNGDFVSLLSAIHDDHVLQLSGDRVALDFFPPEVWPAVSHWLSGTVFLLRPMSPDSFGSWISALFVLAIALLVGLAFPRVVTETGQIVRERTPAAVLTGIAVLPAVVLCCFLLLLTVIGIVVIPFLGALVVIFSLVGDASVFQLIGRTIYPRLADQKYALAGWTCLGAATCWILYCIPIIGFLVGSLVFLAGLGAVSLYVVEKSRLRKAPALLPNASQTDSVAPETAASPVEPKLTVPVKSSAVSFWPRLGANVIDAAVVVSLLYFLGLSRYIIPGWVVYRFAMYAWRSATLGEVVLNFRVQHIDGGGIRGDYGTALVRALASLLSLLPLGLGFFWILFDREHQTWHDKISATEL